MTHQTAVLEPVTTVERKPRKVSRYAHQNAADRAAGKQLVYQHPTTFDEFFNENPKHIVHWLRFKRCPADLIDDFSQELYLHLLTPPSNSGLSDRIGTYNPERMGGYRTKWAWVAYLNRILLNKYIHLISKEKRNHTAGPNIVSLSWIEQPVVSLARDICVSATGLEPEELQKFVTNPEGGLQAKLFLDRFLAYLDEEGSPEAATFVRTLAIYDSIEETRSALGMTQSQAISMMAKIKRHAKTFRMEAF